MTKDPTLEMRAGEGAYISVRVLAVSYVFIN